ncbi:hypothetical protein ABE222_29195 [Bacillus tropicus]|uniref:hypothetical protein n=1 Tax=Bacillus tropicus TaxID=2026188 RepID=UPI003D205926
MKKYLLIATSLLLSIGLVACGSEEPKEEKKDTAQATEQKEEKKESLVEKYKKVGEEKKEKASAFPVSEEAKNMTLEQIKTNPNVSDAHIEVKDTKIVMAVVVSHAVTKEAAKEIGDNFVRNLGSFAGGKAPEKEYYGEIFDNYDVQIGVGTSADKIMVQGYKSTSAKNINW